MQYLLLIYSKEGAWDAMTPAEQSAGIAAYTAYTEALVAAGALLAAQRLRPTSEAATIRAGAGGPQVLDGPYAETKEQLGGFFLIEAPDQAAALAWAARCPGSQHGIVEVRPVFA
jgi:hypothetical protein